MSILGVMKISNIHLLTYLAPYLENLLIKGKYQLKIVILPGMPASNFAF